MTHSKHKKAHPLSTGSQSPFHFTHNNHFRFKSVTEGNERNFYSTITAPQRKLHASGVDEATAAAHKVYQQAQGQPLTLCLSGGVDSEFMLKSFLQAQVPFEICIMKFKEGLNEYDIQSAVSLCETKQLKYNFFEVDALNFFESGQYYTYGELYQCQSPQLALHLHLLDHITGAPVLSGEPPFMTFKRGQVVSFGLPSDLHCCYFRYLIQNKRFGVPWFSIYTPELASSFLHTPSVQELYQRGHLGEDIINSYKIKCLTYQEMGFDISPRADKFTGFESIKKHYDTLDNMNFGQAFNQRFRQPLEELNPPPDHSIQMIESEGPTE